MEQYVELIMPYVTAILPSIAAIIAIVASVIKIRKDFKTLHKDVVDNSINNNLKEVVHYDRQIIEKLDKLIEIEGRVSKNERTNKKIH